MRNWRNQEKNRFVFVVFLYLSQCWCHPHANDVPTNLRRDSNWPSCRRPAYAPMGMARAARAVADADAAVGAGAGGATATDVGGAAVAAVAAADAVADATMCPSGCHLWAQLHHLVHHRHHQAHRQPQQAAPHWRPHWRSANQCPSGASDCSAEVPGRVLCVWVRIVSLFICGYLCECVYISICVYVFVCLCKSFVGFAVSFALKSEIYGLLGELRVGRGKCRLGVVWEVEGVVWSLADTGYILYLWVMIMFMYFCHICRPCLQSLICVSYLCES